MNTNYAAMTDQELNEESWVVVKIAFGGRMGTDPFFKVQHNSLWNYRNRWTPTTDANQALELAEHVRGNVGGYYDSFSPYSIENSTDEEGLKFKFTWYAHNIADERTVSASDKVFARALTITSLLANESLGRKS